MSDAQYSVLRYIPDPGRGERLNIGILLWEDQSGEYRLELDEKAIDRVIRENPRLERDSLLYIEPMLTEQLSSAMAPIPTRIKGLLDGQKGFPLDISEARFTTISEDEDGLDETLERLVKRVVRPKRRGYVHKSPAIEMSDRLKPLIRNQRVSRAYPVRAKSGVERKIDFFANSGSNVALDVLQLAITKADEIRERADAKGMKVIDLLDGSSVKDYLVYCHFADDRQLEDVYGEARTVIEAQGARVIDNADDAAEALENAAAVTA
jgi:Protein of unknown function (DUF3037)